MSFVHIFSLSVIWVVHKNFLAEVLETKVEELHDEMFENEVGKSNEDVSFLRLFPSEACSELAVPV